MRSDYFTAAIVIIALLATFVYVFGFSRPPAEAKRVEVGVNIGENVIAAENQDLLVNELAPIDLDKSTFEFEGFGPGKSHLGTFDEWEGNILMKDGKINGIEGAIQTASVNTGIERLDKDLKSDNFLDVEKYPEISFSSDIINNGEMSGSLTFLGVTKTISFPVVITDDSISTDFIFDSSQFGEMSDLANDEVRIAFKLFAEQ